MGRLLDAMKAGATPPPANIANVANIGPQPSEIFADSQDSQASDFQNGPPERDHQARRLLAAIRAEGLPASLLAADDSEPWQLAELEAAELQGYARGLWRDARMSKGEQPPGWNAAGECSACGPVWLPAGAPARPIACPWCWHRKAGASLPRPPVRCGGCRHYLADPINPEGGFGRCGLTGKPSNFPMASHVCEDHQGRADA